MQIKIPVKSNFESTKFYVKSKLSKYLSSSSSPSSEDESWSSTTSGLIGASRVTRGSLVNLSSSSELESVSSSESTSSTRPASTELGCSRALAKISSRDDPVKQKNIHTFKIYCIRTMKSNYNKLLQIPQIIKKELEGKFV